MSKGLYFMKGVQELHSLLGSSKGMMLTYFSDTGKCYIAKLVHTNGNRFVITSDSVSGILTIRKNGQIKKTVYFYQDYAM